MSVLRYVGSKQKLLKQIDEAIQLEDTAIWVEPFCGSLTVSLFMLKKYPKIRMILNDKNSHLIRFYRFMKNSEEFESCLEHIHQMIKKFNEDQQYYYEARREINQEVQEHARFAALYYFINRTCFNGVTRYNKKGEFNVPLGKNKQNWKLLLNSLKEFRSLLYQHPRITFTSMDYEHCIRAYAEPNAFLYCDPPYDDTFSQYTAEWFKRDDQQVLHDCLVKSGVPFLVHNTNNERICELYKHCNKHVVETSRSVGGKRGKMEEVMFISK